MTLEISRPILLHGIPHLYFFLLVGYSKNKLVSKTCNITIETCSYQYQFMSQIPVYFTIRIQEKGLSFITFDILVGAIFYIIVCNILHVFMHLCSLVMLCV